MDRGELTITVLGLVATFCLPWPGADKALRPDQKVAVRVVAAESPRDLQQIATFVRTANAARAAQPAR